MVAYVNECFFRAKDRGLVDFVVDQAIPGFLTPAQCSAPAITDAQTYYYRAETDDLTQRELGLGTWSAATNTLARTTIYQSSNANAKVDFPSSPRIRLELLAQGVNLKADQTSVDAITSNAADDQIALKAAVFN